MWVVALSSGLASAVRVGPVLRHGCLPLTAQAVVETSASENRNPNQQPLNPHLVLSGLASQCRTSALLCTTAAPHVLRRNKEGSKIDNFGSFSG
ncbi:unnamed protein product [Lactuca virosa]|uniref:Secreted protein n=1 Tax=Lactuca virosa TaxID=75947 RepID=A0AAU9L9Z8_9ASTR|nr:unnamed protein product [Lactuca virosa]